MIHAKQMPLAEFSRLRNLMSLTNSDQDGEALNAIRAANRLLAKNRLSWSDVFDRTITVDAAVPAHEDKDAERDATDRKVQMALDELRRTKRGSGDFFKSVDARWAREAYLSQGQRMALFNMLKEHREERR